MPMTREEREYAIQVSDESKAARKQAIEAAGPLFDASRTTELRRLLKKCHITDDADISSLLTSFAKAGSDDEADVKDKVRTALNDAVKKAFQIEKTSDAFIDNGTAAIVSVIDEAMTQRDAAIVRNGGPAKPRAFMTFNF